jgi:hypothetical protein
LDSVSVSELTRLVPLWAVSALGQASIQISRTHSRQKSIIRPEPQKYIPIQLSAYQSFNKNIKNKKKKGFLLIGNRSFEPALALKIEKREPEQTKDKRQKSQITITKEKNRNKYIEDRRSRNKNQ